MGGWRGDGLEDKELAAELRIRPATIARWRNRFWMEGGGRGGEGRVTTGSATRDYRFQGAAGHRNVDREKRANATQWSTRTMAAAAGGSGATVRRIWHAQGLKPHLVRTFKHPPATATVLNRQIPVATTSSRSDSISSSFLHRTEFAVNQY